MLIALFYSYYCLALLSTINLKHLLLLISLVYEQNYVVFRSLCEIKSGRQAGPCSPMVNFVIEFEKFIWSLPP